MIVKSYVNTFEGSDLFFGETDPIKKLKKHISEVAANPLFPELTYSEKNNVLEAICMTYKRFGLLTQEQIEQVLHELSSTELKAYMTGFNVTKH